MTPVRISTTSPGRSAVPCAFSACCRSAAVIEYDVGGLGLCTGITAARYTTTTEVYPDSPRATPEQCNAAQVAAVCAGIEFALRVTSASAT